MTLVLTILALVLAVVSMITAAVLAGRVQATSKYVPAHLNRQAQLTAEALDALNQRLKALERIQPKDVPGVTEEQKDWAVIVGGERVPVKTMQPADWLEAMQELPEYVYIYAQNQAQGKALESKDFESILNLAKKWIKACAEGEVNLDRLSIPEAEHAVSHIAGLNGVTENLREFFRQRIKGLAQPSQDSQPLRSATVRARRDTIN